jgi:hypothetical protein
MKRTSSLNKISRYVSEDQQFWQIHLSAFASSGVSRRAYCRKHGVNYDRFTYWKNRIEICPDNDKPTQASKKCSAPSPSALLPVQLKSAIQPSLPQDDMAILGSLHLKNGSVLRIHDAHAFNIILERFV